MSGGSGNTKKSKKRPEGAFCKRLRLRATDLDRVGTFRTFRNFEGERVALSKLIEADADELFRVKEDIFLHALYLDEPESLVGETSNSSSLHDALALGG